MDTAASNKNIVASFFEALNNNDIDSVVNTYADDGYVQTMGDTLISGPVAKANIASYAGGTLEVFPKGLKFVVHDMVAEGDKVAVEAESEGEHVSGLTYNNEYHFLFEFRDGKLIKLKEYMDTEMVTEVLCAGQRPPFGT